MHAAGGTSRKFARIELSSSWWNCSNLIARFAGRVTCSRRGASRRLRGGRVGRRRRAASFRTSTAFVRCRRFCTRAKRRTLLTSGRLD